MGRGRVRSVMPTRLRLLLGDRFVVRYIQHDNAQGHAQKTEAEQNAVGYRRVMPGVLRGLKLVFIDGS